MRLRTKGTALIGILELSKNFTDQIMLSANSYSNIVYAGYWITRKPEEYQMPLDPLYVYKAIKAQVSELDRAIFINCSIIQNMLKVKGNETCFEIDGDSKLLKLSNGDIYLPNIDMTVSSVTIPEIDEEGVVSLNNGYYAWSFQEMPESVIKELNSLI